MNTATAKITRTNVLPVRLVKCDPITRYRQGEKVSLITWQVRQWTPTQWLTMGDRPFAAQPSALAEAFAMEGVA